MPPLLRPPDLGFYWSRRAQRPADHGRGRGDQICNWGQQARGGNCIICKKLWNPLSVIIAIKKPPHEATLSSFHTDGP
uniref:Uncharacterized protein n=1 Tax=Oryza glumipatula TaxID=40148 RepID=A0A0E0AVN9_9ORYZ